MTCDKCGRGTIDDFGGRFTAVHLSRAGRAVGEPRAALAIERDGAEVRLTIMAPGVRIEVPDLDRAAVTTLARMFADVDRELSIVERAAKEDAG